MKDLSTYINEACSISESRRLSDLKGKQVGKIEVDSSNLEWKKRIVSSEPPIRVVVNNMRALSDGDIAEIYSHFLTTEYVQVWYNDDNGKGYVTEFSVDPDNNGKTIVVKTRRAKDQTNISINQYIKNDYKSFVKQMRLYQKKCQMN